MAVRFTSYLGQEHHPHTFTRLSDSQLKNVREVIYKNQLNPGNFKNEIRISLIDMHCDRLKSIKQQESSKDDNSYYDRLKSFSKESNFDQDDLFVKVDIKN